MILRFSNLSIKPIPNHPQSLQKQLQQQESATTKEESATRSSSMAFICGSLNSQQEDDFEVLWPFASTPPRKPTRRRLIFGSRSSRHGANNPYSSRGLDRFEALLADLDDKKQKILTQKGSEDISLIRFVYKNPDEVTPVIVKLSHQRKNDTLDLAKPTTSSPETPTSEHQKDASRVVGNNAAVNESEEAQQRHSWPKFDQWKRQLVEWWQPWYYLPLFLILILILLIFSGRSFTILCTSLGWYLIPIVNETLHNSKKPKKITKKRHLRKARDEHIASAQDNLGIHR